MIIPGSQRVLKILDPRSAIWIWTAWFGKMPMINPAKTQYNISLQMNFVLFQIQVNFRVKP